MHRPQSILIGFLIILFQCKQIETKNSVHPNFIDYDSTIIPYRLYQPDEKIKLHFDLEEISALSYYKDNLLAAIEDETGKMYLLDAKNGEVKQRIKFAKGGDYEGIEIKDEHAFVIESNGTLYDFEIADKPNVRITKTSLSSKNDVEGLSIIRDNLLIACKGSGEIEDFKLDGKGIYLYENNQLTPYLSIAKQDLLTHIEGREYFNTFTDFDPSAIAVHPTSGDIYILSADHILVVYSAERKLLEIVKLDNKLFRQPEGMCFSPDGKMFIASEGDGERGELFIFKQLPVL